jgi:hypothetical protein
VGTQRANRQRTLHSTVNVIATAELERTNFTLDVCEQHVICNALGVSVYLQCTLTIHNMEPLNGIVVQT